MWAEGMNALQISAISGHKDLRILRSYSHYQLEDGGIKAKRLVKATSMIFLKFITYYYKINQPAKKQTLFIISSVNESFE